MTNLEWWVVIVRKVKQIYKTPLCDLTPDERIVIANLDALGIKNLKDFVAYEGF